MAVGEGPALRIAIVALLGISIFLIAGSFTSPWYSIDGPSTLIEGGGGKKATFGETDYLQTMWVDVRFPPEIVLSSKFYQGKMLTAWIPFSYSEANLPHVGRLCALVLVLMIFALALAAAAAVLNLLALFRYRLSGKVGEFLKRTLFKILVVVATVLATVLVGAGVFTFASVPSARAQDGGTDIAGCGTGAPKGGYCDRFTGIGYGPGTGWGMAIAAFFLLAAASICTIVSGLGIRIRRGRVAGGGQTLSQTGSSPELGLSESSESMTMNEKTKATPATANGRPVGNSNNTNNGDRPNGLVELEDVATPDSSLPAFR